MPHHRKARSKSKSKSPSRRRRSLDESYPAIAQYISGWGWIEVGDVDDFRKSRDRGIVARALDGGGMVWETKRPCKDSDDAFRKLELALRKKLAQES
jgi:hypothetical protein